MRRKVAALSWAVVAACTFACGKTPAPRTFSCGGLAEGATARGPRGTAVEVHAVVDLPRCSSTQELSGTAFDETTRTLYALEDKAPRIVHLLSASADFRSWTLGSQIHLSGYADDSWDGEGLVRLPDGSFYVVTNERTPAIAHFDARGVFIERVNIPAHYTKQSPNKGLESLTLSPDARYLFTANESALLADGAHATPAKGTLVRILRRDLANGADEEFAYRTEPLGAGKAGDMGVAELTAFSGTDLLVLERGYQRGYGNTVRIFRVNLAGAKSVLYAPSLDDGSPIVDKTLLVDLVSLHCAGVTHAGPQPNPILENYEAMTLGPTLPDGRRVLFLTSDDNGRSEQVPRILVLALKI